MSLVFAAILPHGPGVIAELAEDPGLMAATRIAMEEAGRRFAAARVDTVILLDPQTVHTLQGVAIEETRLGRPTLFPHMEEGAFAVGTAADAAGTLGGAHGRSVTDRYACDLALAETILNAGRRDFPVVPAAGKEGELALYGGALIPLWFTLRPLPAPRPGLVVIYPSPALPGDLLLRFGGLLADVAASSGRRVALIASADQGHTHDRNHPRFGFSPAAAEHDALYCQAVAESRLDRLLEISDDLLRESWADSLWQTLILAGALRAVPMAVELLSYAVPTYFGMAVAVYEPPPAAGTNARLQSG